MSSNVPKGQRKEPLMSRLANKFNLGEWISDTLNISEELPTSMLKKVGFAFMLVLTYIFFQHNFETLIRGLDKAEREIKEKRAEFISHKSSYMFKSKHSQVSTALEKRGLLRNIEPPVKIVVLQ